MRRGMEGSLRRQLGTTAAVLLGLGSIVGTGVFVSIGIAAGVAGPSVVSAVAAAGLVAAANGLSSAQLAAAHPVSGGTYVYAGRLLSPGWGFVAGWMFLGAKTASAATAALGFSGYLLAATGWPPGWHRFIALGIVALVGAAVLRGIRRSATVNGVLVGFVIAALGMFVVAGIADVSRQNIAAAAPTLTGSWFEAAALMFVAYTGYGRIATLGEEVRDPVRTIPRAIVTTMAITIALYGLVAVVAIGSIGAAVLAAATETSTAPLVAAAGHPGVARLVEVAAIVAMASVLLNLVLGVSRVVLAMGREGDLPHRMAAVDATGTTPVPATVATLAAVAGLTLIGNVTTTWTFSAVTVLIYYTLTNLAALRLRPEQRRFPRWIAAGGAAACLGLAVFVEPLVWLATGLLLAVGFGLRAVLHRRTTARGTQ